MIYLATKARARIKRNGKILGPSMFGGEFVVADSDVDLRQRCKETSYRTVMHTERHSSIIGMMRNRQATKQ